MKKSLLFIAMLLASVQMFGQDPYALLKPGITLESTSYDAKGKEVGKSRVTVLEAAGDARNFQGTMLSEVEQNGQTITSVTSDITITNGNATVSVGGGTINTEASSADIFAIPNKLAVGQKLGVGPVTINIGGMKVKSTITENDVIGREEITTPAGTFRCYIIQQTTEAKILGIKGETTLKIWYARGIGQVKKETYQKGKLQSTEILTSIIKK